MTNKEVELGLKGSLRTKFSSFKDKLLPCLQHDFLKSHENVLYSITLYVALVLCSVLF